MRWCFSATRSRRAGATISAAAFPGCESRQSRHQRRHHPRRAHPPAGGCPRAASARRRAAHRHQRSRGKRRPRNHRGKSQADPRPAESAQSAMPIVLCQVFPSSTPRSAPPTQIKQINQLYAEAVKDDAAGHAARYLDTCSPMRRATPSRRNFPTCFIPTPPATPSGPPRFVPILATLGLRRHASPTISRRSPASSASSTATISPAGATGRPPTTDIESAEGWQASDPNAAEWPIVTKSSTFDGKTATPDGRYRRQERPADRHHAARRPEDSETLDDPRIPEKFHRSSSSFAPRRTPTAASSSAGRSCSAATTSSPARTRS